MKQWIAYHIAFDAGSCRSVILGYCYGGTEKAALNDGRVKYGMACTDVTMKNRSYKGRAKKS